MVIAIETSARFCSVAAGQDGELLNIFTDDTPMQHSKRIGMFVQQVLSKNKKKPQLLAVALGPGSFTGLRIGLSYAQGFCFGNGVPIVGVSNHQILAAEADGASTIYTLIDARRDEGYLAVHKNNEIFEIASHQIVKYDDLINTLPENAQLVIHEDVILKQPLLQALVQKKIVVKQKIAYSLQHLMHIAEKQHAEKGADNIAEIEPMYIRPFSGM